MTISLGESTPIEQEVIVDRNVCPLLGLRVKYLANFGLQITGLKSTGAIALWNDENPSKQVQEYDCILEVNSIRGDPHVMFEALKQTMVIRMIVRCTGALEQWLRLQYRDLRPEVYALLTALDDSSPTLTQMRRIDVVTLPRLKASECELDMCSICLHDFEEDELTTQLPCKHNFCTACIERWLTQEKDSCPLCCTPCKSSDACGGSSCPAHGEDGIESDGMMSLQVPHEHVSVQRPRIARRFSHQLKAFLRQSASSRTTNRAAAVAVTSRQLPSRLLAGFH